MAFFFFCSGLEFGGHESKVRENILILNKRRNFNVYLFRLIADILTERKNNNFERRCGGGLLQRAESNKYLEWNNR